MRGFLIIFTACCLACLYSHTASAACFYNESESKKSVEFICGLFCADNALIGELTAEKNRPDRKCRASRSGLSGIADAFFFDDSRQEAICSDARVDANGRFIILSDESVLGCEVAN